jgi:hypothetical protein
MKRTIKISRTRMAIIFLLPMLGLFMPINSIFAQVGQGYGTGFALSTEGYIATAAHVVKDVFSIKVMGIGDNPSISYNAKVMAYNTEHDVAIIKIEDPQFTALGQIPYVIKETGVKKLNACFVMGYPETELLDTTLKATSGHVNGIKETEYQFDAPCQHGNSGSPLFSTEDGTVIGVVVSRVTEAENDSWWGGSSDVIQNANFASKISYIKHLADSLGIQLPTDNQMQGRPSDMVEQAAPFVYRIILHDISSISSLLEDHPQLDIRNLKEVFAIDDPLSKDILCGQPKTITEEKYSPSFYSKEIELTGKNIKSYNKQGRLLSEKQYNEYDDLKSQTDYLYDVNNLLMEIYVTEFDISTEEETLVGKIVLNRNSQNQILGVTSYYLLDLDTVCLQRVIFTYEDKKCSKIYLSDSKDQSAEEERNTTTYIFNEYNQIVSLLSGFVWNDIHYEYLNPHTHIVSKATSSFWGTKINYTVKKFHKSGKPLKTVTQYGKIKYYTKYEYDKQNNWVFMQEGQDCTIRNIEYY